MVLDVLASFCNYLAPFLNRLVSFPPVVVTFFPAVLQPCQQINKNNGYSSGIKGDFIGIVARL